MKKILILAYDFPPYVSVGGLRPYSWYKYFYEYGLYPVVVTRQWSNRYGNYLDYISPSESKNTIVEKSELGCIIRSPYYPNIANRLLLKYGESKFKLIRQIVTAFNEFFQYFFLIGPKTPIYWAANEYLKNNKVDCIIATGDPFILFKYAKKLGAKYNIPWIADYRDPWVRSIKTSYNLFIFLLYKFLEKNIVSKCAAVIAVSEFVRHKIHLKNPQHKYYIIPNGYDEELIEKTKKIIPDTTYLNIAIVGTIYPYHPIYSVLSVINNFISDNPVYKIKLNFYGTNIEDKIQKQLSLNYIHLKPHVHFYNKIPNEIYLKELAKNHIMLLFNQYSYMGTKIYDYIAMNKTILLCYSDDKEAKILKEKFYDINENEKFSTHLQEDLIKTTNSGYIVKDKNHLKILLSELYNEFIKTGNISVTGNEKIIWFSRQFQTQQLAQIIKQEIIDKSKQRYYQQCTRCVMDTSDIDIVFDENGYCNHCNNYLYNTSLFTYKPQKSDILLQELIKKIIKAGRNKKYDCIIGLSGGVDSCYTAYKAKELGLRALCVHMDNGWNSELAVANIKYIVDNLGFDYQSYVLDWDEFKDLQLAFLKASVPEMETPTDIAIPAALHKIAAQYNCKYIFSGGNYVTEGILPKTWHYNAKDTKYLKAIHKKFGTKKLRQFPTFGYLDEMYYKLIKRIRIIYLLNYVDYNKKKAQKILEKELGWRYYGGKHHESKYTEFVQSYILFKKFNIDYRRATFSTQICAGTLSRDKALSELKKKPYDDKKIADDTEYICKKLGISIEEFTYIMFTLPKIYRDYPNNEKLLELIYKIYRWLNKK